MLRSITAICCVLAAAAVLFTYHTKHDVQVLDHKIERTLADTAALREQSRGLQAEWTLRENPERLRTFADQYLALKPVLPGQFTTLADLDSRLPAPQTTPVGTGTTDTTEEPADATVASAQPQVGVPAEVPAEVPVGTATATDVPAEPAPADETVIAEEELPVPPLPIPAPPAALAANTVVTAPRPAPPHPAPPHPAPAALVQAQPVRLTQPARQAAAMQVPPVRAMPVRVPPVQTHVQPPPMQTGSLLAIGRGSAFAPMPRPIPVSTAPYTYGR